MRLLLIEDEQRLAEALAYILRKKNYAVDTAFDGLSGQDLAVTGIYDLIILDRMLPGRDGLSVLRNLRAMAVETPVLLLTAKDTIEDRVDGLDAGADDYLVKPFATEELLARVRALGRRNNTKLQGENISFAGLIFDPLQCEVTRDTEKVKLTLKESLLFELFMRNPGQVITREQILDRVWGFDSEVEMNNIEIYIHYLRKKLPLKGLQIETIRGVGYCLKEIAYVP